MIRQLSRNITLTILDENRKQASTDHNTSINRLAEAIAGIVSQQRHTASAILKPASTNTLLIDGKNEKFEIIEDLFHTMLKMQLEKTSNENQQFPLTLAKRKKP